jgi:hypothetical protein
MAFEDHFGDPLLRVQVGLCVNKSLEWKHNFPDTKLTQFDMWDLEHMIHEEIEKRDGYSNGWEITNRMITVQANKTRARRQMQSIDDFSESEWDKVVKVILSQEGDFDPEYIALHVEISVQAPKGMKKSIKRTYDVLSSDPVDPPLEPAKRATRTTQLLNRLEKRGEALEASGEFDKQLLTRWQCPDERCRNHGGWCFRDNAGLHFVLSHHHQMVWAKAIANGEIGITLENPPERLHNVWKTQGPLRGLRKALWQRRKERRQNRKE